MRLLSQPVEVDEHFYLRAQDIRHHRRQYVIYCTECVALSGVHLFHVRRKENNGRMHGSLAHADIACSFESVHARHVYIEQNDGDVVFEQTLKRLLA